MAFYLGSFAQGLFSGAQSAFTSYAAYQGIRQTDLDWDIGKERMKMDDQQDYTPLVSADPNLKPTTTKDKYGTTQISSGSSGASNAGPGPAPSAESGPGKGPVDPKKISGPAAPGPGPGIASPAYDTPPPPLPADINRVGPPQVSPGIVTATRPAMGATPGEPTTPYPNAPATSAGSVDEFGRPIPRANVTVQQLPTPPAAAPVDEYGRPVPAITPSAPAPYGPPPPPPQRAARPPDPPFPGLTNPAANSFTYPTPQPPPPVTSGEAMRVPVPQPPPPPQVSGDAAAGAPTDGRGNYYDRAEGQWKPIPSVQTGTAPASGGAPATGGNVILGALSHLSPVSSAQAADQVTPAMRASVPTGAPPAAAPAAAPPSGITPAAAPAAPTAPAAPASGWNTPGAPQTPTAPGAPAAAAPGTRGIGETLAPTPPSPATPSGATGAPSQQAAPPATIPGYSGHVAPHQQGPSEQSQTTQPTTGVPVHPSFGAALIKNYPDSAKEVQSLIDQFGGGVVTFDQVAATWYRENGFKWQAPVGEGKPIGPMQLVPSTWNDVSAMAAKHGIKLDPNNPRDGMIAGIVYLKYLSNDLALGANTPSTNYAYRAGPQAAARMHDNYAAEKQAHPDWVRDLENMYQGVKLDSSMFTPGSMGQNNTNYQNAVLQQNTPDGVLSIMATMGPQGLGMTDRWRHLQAMMEGSAIARGRYDMLPHISDYIAQTSHQGALSNLMAGYTAMQAGDMQGAAGALAKAHAFFPDGSYARFGVDSSNRMFAEQFDERTNTPLGKPFMVSTDMIASQMVALQNPRTFLETLQKYQKTNAEIGLDNARGKYYAAQPGVKEALQTQRLEHQTEMQQERLRHQDALGAAKSENAEATAEHNVDGRVDTDFKERMTAAQTELEGAQTALKADPNSQEAKDKLTAATEARERLGRESQVSRELRMPVLHGGHGMAGPAADSLATGVVSGKYDVQPITRNGKPQYGVYDKGTTKDDINSGKAQPHALLSNARGLRIHGLAGAQGIGDTNAAAVAAPPAAKPAPVAPAIPPSRLQVSSIGAGLNDPRMAGRFNTNLAGIQPTSQAA